MDRCARLILKTCVVQLQHSCFEPRVQSLPASSLSPSSLLTPEYTFERFRLGSVL